MSNFTESLSSNLLVNLSVLFSKPTGISTYAANLFPHLQPLNPTLLISPLAANFEREASRFPCYSVPADMTPEQGTKGHFRRLLWTQLQLPRIYQKLRRNSPPQTSHLLFSPLPEAPLFTNCRYIVTVHDLIPLRFPRRGSPLTTYFRYYIPQVLSQAQHILCDSQATAKDITNFYNIPANKITPVLLAYNPKDFRFLDLPTSNYFLYIGRHDPYKNLPRLLDAFAGLDDHDCELWIAGSPDGRYTPLLQAQVNHLGLTERVKFLDYVAYEQLPIIINQAIALIFPSLWEGFGLPVLEAMACGTPVITSNLSSLPEVAGEAALFVNPYNTGEITEAMQAIVTDSRLRSHLRTLSLDRASQFSWEKTGVATMEVLQHYL
ncbi:MAG: glycosyltransferase family 4 protein [Microcoleus sp. SIO2G3]|nr:glycosyltransferase family 4 protein [Microcoleus sp. SIO2G3]